MPVLMHTGRVYAHAPIREAAVEIRCQPSADLALETLQQAVDRELFSEEERLIEVMGQVDVSGEDITGETKARQIGFAYRRPDRNHAIQSRFNGFTFGWLEQYKDWHALYEETSKSWSLYSDVVKPSRIVRLGVRFINQIVVPQSSIEIGDYLRIAVDVPPSLPQMVSSYFLRVQVPFMDTGVTLNLSSALADSPDESSSVLILDIDAWKNADLGVQGEEARESLRQQLELLRHAKNHAFEACITDATRRLIE